MTEEDNLIVEIMKIAYLVHRLTRYCVFIRFSGHINQCEIDIRESKEHWQQEVLSTEFYTEYERLSKWEHNPLAYLQAKKNILLKIIEDEEIPYDECDVEQHVVSEYSF